MNKTSRNRTSRKSTGTKDFYYSRLSPADLDRIAAPFDKEFIPTKPLTPAMRRQEERAKRKRGRPIIGQGSEKVLVTLEKGLLRDADNYARLTGQNRSKLIANGLRTIIYSGRSPASTRPKAA